MADDSELSPHGPRRDDEAGRMQEGCVCTGVTVGMTCEKEKLNRRTTTWIQTDECFACFLPVQCLTGRSFAQWFKAMYHTRRGFLRLGQNQSLPCSHHAEHCPNPVQIFRIFPAFPSPSQQNFGLHSGCDSHRLFACSGDLQIPREGLCELVVTWRATSGTDGAFLGCH